MTQLINVTLNGTLRSFPRSTTVFQMLSVYPADSHRTALGAVVGNRVSGLHRRIHHDATIQSIDGSTREGMEIYRRTASLMFFAALAEMNPAYKVEVGQSIDEGYYFEPIGFRVTDAIVRELDAIMHRFVTAAIHLDLTRVPIEQAIGLFEQQGRRDRVRILEHVRRSDVPLLTIGAYTGYAHGPVAPNTGCIDQFKLHAMEDGFVLEFPNQAGELAGTIAPRPKLMAAYRERKAWNHLVDVANVAQLNEHAKQGTISEVIKIAEALHEKKIAALADAVAARPSTRFVLIAGPSSSGKTTFTKRLAIQLKVCGLRPVMLSLDDYFVDRDASPRHADGSYNFEAPEALDLPLLNEHLRALAAGEQIQIPVFSFPLGQRTDKSHPLQLTPDQIVLIEGIHGLNPQLSQSIAPELKFKIFISALTQLCIDDHHRIFTSDSRLLRRMVRDRRYRGTNAAVTLERWPSVRHGESAYIMPFQETADMLFDSSLCYEQAVLHTYAMRFLTEVPRSHPSYVEALRLFRFLDLFVPVFPEEVPGNSLLREFIGDSTFRY